MLPCRSCGRERRSRPGCSWSRQCSSYLVGDGQLGAVVDEFGVDGRAVLGAADADDAVAFEVVDGGADVYGAEIAVGGVGLDALDERRPGGRPHRAVPYSRVESAAVRSSSPSTNDDSSSSSRRPTGWMSQKRGSRAPRSVDDPESAADSRTVPASAASSKL